MRSHLNYLPPLRFVHACLLLVAGLSLAWLIGHAHALWRSATFDELRYGHLLDVLTRHSVCLYSWHDPATDTTTRHLALFLGFDGPTGQFHNLASFPSWPVSLLAFAALIAALCAWPRAARS